MFDILTIIKLNLYQTNWFFDDQNKYFKFLKGLIEIQFINKFNLINFYMHSYLYIAKGD